MTNTQPPAGPAEVEAARLLLARMGLSPEDLVTAPAPRPAVPTFAEYLPIVEQAVGAGTRRVYGTYWKRVLAVWGERTLDDITPSEIKQLAERMKSQVVLRRNARGGRGAAEHLIAAVRCVYNHAVADGLITESDNPARKVPKPRRLPSNRHGLPDKRVAEINRIVSSTGNDPALDALLLRLHTETACRRGGALALRPCDLDLQSCLIRLREKGETTRWQPVSRTLITHLRAHATDRGAGDDQQLLRSANGTPITARRYDYLWARVRQHLPWAAAQQVSTHWLRHTTLTWVERTFSYAVARAYAGHSHSTSDAAGTTATYVQSDLPEVAAALAELTGESHPLAPLPEAEEAVT